MGVLTSKDDDRSQKEALPLLNVIGQLCSNLEPGSPQITGSLMDTESLYGTGSRCVVI